MTALHDFIHDLRHADLPPEVDRMARLLLRDLLGVAAGALETSLSRIVRDHAARHFGPGAASARMLFDGRRVSPAGAALAGGMTIDALDAHDGHRLTKGHAGCGALPALLAFADAEGVETFGELLTGLVLGYEIGTRAGVALHRTAADYHTSGAWTAVSCAAIGARILRLDRARTREALGIAEYHGPRSPMMRCIDHPTMVKDGSGWGAMAGVSAAYLAADGFTGAPALTVEGAEIADLWADLGASWRILEQYVKPWPVCRWAQPAVHAALTLRETHGLGGDDVERVEIATFHEATRLAGARPRSTEAAQYAIVFPVAAALARGRLGPEEMREAALESPEILRIAAVTRLTEDAGANAAFPARRLARVEIVTRAGARHALGPVEAPGDPEQPLGDGWLADKFASYAEPVLGEDRASFMAGRLLQAASPDAAGDVLDMTLFPPRATDPSKEASHEVRPLTTRRP